jgi:hypothetical protein
MMLKEDLERMVPYWISYTEAVRADPDVRNLPRLPRRILQLCRHVVHNV